MKAKQSVLSLAIVGLLAAGTALAYGPGPQGGGMRMGGGLVRCQCRPTSPSATCASTAFARSRSSSSAMTLTCWGVASTPCTSPGLAVIVTSSTTPFGADRPPTGGSSRGSRRPSALPCVADRRDVGKLRRRDESPEEAARRVRRAFLLEVAGLAGSEHVALGHTLDDQAETVLMRLARGAGPTALAGMAPAGPGPVVRPALGLTRAQLRHWLVRHLELIETEKPDVVLVEFAERHSEYFFRVMTNESQ